MRGFPAVFGLVAGIGVAVSAQSVVPTAVALEAYAGGDRTILSRRANDGLPPIWTIAEDLGRLPRSITLPGKSAAETGRDIAAFAIEAARTLETQNVSSMCQLVGATRSRWVAKGSRDEFARRWHAAAIATLLRSDCLPAAEQAVAAALADFPTESRFRLARAVVAEQQIAGSVAAGNRPSERDVRDAETRFKLAMAFPDVAKEAALRWARVNALIGRHEAAAALSAEAVASPETRLNYLAHLFRGWSLAALGKLDEADAEYSRALAIVPGSQSAMLGRAAAVFRQRHAVRAEAIVVELTSRPASIDDPWWTYAMGDGNRVDELIVELRKVIRQVGK